MTIWITCQLGAREHYAIPRALQQAGKLHTLITDAWVTPHSLFHRIPGKVGRSLGDRYYPDLTTASIKAFTPSLLGFELQQRLTHNTGWPSILARNQWFQQNALQTLRKLKAQLPANSRPILFSYSYTALELFRYAKQQGWITVLGQIDPGPAEEKLVAQLQLMHGKYYNSIWTPAPVHYWHSWHQQCELADNIIVNSLWSETALIQSGIPKQKISVVPLAYDSPSASLNFSRSYPSSFNSERPMRVLFLGQIILRKGVAALIKAIPLLEKMSIEIWLVGSTELNLLKDIKPYPQVKLIGSVPRSQVSNYYQQADVFLFPTHCDGFGLTQLEAQSWKLPIIASTHCGEVVKHQNNGIILSDVTPQRIAEALTYCYENPNELAKWSQHTDSMTHFSLENLSQRLINLTRTLYSQNLDD